MDREATKVLFCPTGTTELLHKRWREGERKEEEKDRVPSGISLPAAPSGTRHERHTFILTGRGTPKSRDEETGRITAEGQTLKKQRRKQKDKCKRQE